jgi:hypothetical protein
MVNNTRDEPIIIELDTVRAQRLAREAVGGFLRPASVQANSRELVVLKTSTDKLTGFLLARQWRKHSDDLRQYGATDEVLRGIQEHCYLFAYYLLCVVAGG